MLKPSPAKRQLLSQRLGSDATQWIHVSQLTFGSFDQFDLNDGLQHGSAAPHVQPDDGAGDLQGFHRLAVGNFGHV